MLLALKVSDPAPAFTILPKPESEPLKTMSLEPLTATLFSSAALKVMLSEPDVPIDMASDDDQLAFAPMVPEVKVMLLLPPELDFTQPPVPRYRLPPFTITLPVPEALMTISSLSIVLTPPVKTAVPVTADLFDKTNPVVVSVEVNRPLVTLRTDAVLLD
ncbi:MAG: hypothetical protein QOD99_2363 [Chthoniobacter sp.]|nr:hypothetical protein [Chthoniobacter sp.]